MPSVVHYKRTPLALAPDALCGAISRYSDWQAFLTSDARDPNLKDAKVVHFHNCWLPHEGPQLIQYHSEPSCPNLMHDFSGKRLVVAQYQATLPEYADCLPIRNLIDFYNPLFDFQPVETFRVGYSPSITGRVNKWYDKGFVHTRDILTRLQEQFRWLEVDIITGVPYEECIQRKAQCSIIIDECVTGSYHRSGLEGLALGKLTIAWLSDAVQDVVRRVTNQRLLPFWNVSIENLEDDLTRILQDWAPSDLVWWGERNRRWMEAYWSPQEIVEEVVGIYERLIQAE